MAAAWIWERNDEVDEQKLGFGEEARVGRSSGQTKVTIMAYALEYNDEKGICFLTNFLRVGENQQAFNLEGDSGSLVLMIED
ncbi:hypothetical protein L7F22_057313 [Adiantum nelumboides]|nr:hypothetical protein [Adiantum nelumboides]